MQRDSDVCSFKFPFFRHGLYRESCNAHISPYVDAAKYSLDQLFKKMKRRNFYAEIVALTSKSFNYVRTKLGLIAERERRFMFPLILIKPAFESLESLNLSHI